MPADILIQEYYRIRTRKQFILKTGFEDIGIAVSVWGDKETDKQLRGNGIVDVLNRGLKNYKDDNRVVWYFTLSEDIRDSIFETSLSIIENGNYISFNFYGDVSGQSTPDFGGVCKEIEKLIKIYPDKIIFTKYLSYVISTGQLHEQSWGHHVMFGLICHG